jgi:hypothetical protein
MGVGDLAALAGAAHVGEAGLAVGSAIRFLAMQEIEIEIVYNMYRMRRFFTKKPDASAAVSGPSQLCHTGNLQVKARPLTT